MKELNNVSKGILDKAFKGELSNMLNGQMHDWYRSVFGAPPYLIGKLIQELGITNTSVVMDPFCGTGTTNVECKSRLIKSIGTDVNPVSILASRVKTTWNIDSTLAETLGKKILIGARHSYLHISKKIRLSSYKNLRKISLGDDQTFKYLDKYGMLERGWINADPLLRVLLVKQKILHLDIPNQSRDLLLLALLEVVRRVANIRFGPELYCRRKQKIPCAFLEFEKIIKKMACDLQLPSAEQIKTPSLIFEQDARDLSIFTKNTCIPNPDFVITSPPYPTEHDYTRNTRLELAFLESVVDLNSLRKIKKLMIRSNSKSIYNDDNDGEYVKEIPSIKRLFKRIKKKARDKKYAFAKMYPLIISEYFGGMFRHFRSLSSILNQGGKCAYIVGDQSSYLGVHISTADLLADLIRESGTGLQVNGIVKIRDRRGTTGSRKNIAERILFVSK